LAQWFLVLIYIFFSHSPVTYLVIIKYILLVNLYTRYGYWT